MPKLHTFREFTALPPGAIFSTSDQFGNVRGLFRKGTSRASAPETEDHYGPWADFYYHDLLPDATDGDATNWPDIHDGGRWGNFDPEELFVVYDGTDVAKLVGMLTGTTPGDD